MNARRQELLTIASAPSTRRILVSNKGSELNRMLQTSTTHNQTRVHHAHYGQTTVKCFKARADNEQRVVCMAKAQATKSSLVQPAVKRTSREYCPDIKYNIKILSKPPHAPLTQPLCGHVNLNLAIFHNDFSVTMATSAILKCFCRDGDPHAPAPTW